MFKEKLNSCAQYSCDNNLKSVIDYVFLTYFQHYKLYQFVLTQERADDITKVHLIVEPPRPVTVMREAIPKSVWDEQQRIKRIDQIEQERKQVCFAVPFNDMRTPKFKAQPTNALFCYCQSNVQQLLPASDYCHSLFICLNCAQ